MSNDKNSNNNNLTYKGKLKDYNKENVKDTGITFKKVLKEFGCKLIRLNQN